MFSWFKKYFTPNEKNDFKPYALRIRATIIVLSVLLLVQIFFLLQSFYILPYTNLTATIFPTVVVELVNDERVLQSSKELTTSRLLTNAAQQKADDMAQRGYFDHIDPEGRYPWYWFDKLGYRYAYAGENIAIHFFDSKDLLSAWMDSPAHKENILNDNFSEIGIGVSQGLYNGRKTAFIVQFFGTPITNTAPIVKPVLTENTVEAETPEVELVETTQAVAGISELRSSPFDNIVASPRTATTHIYTTFFTIIALMLFLNIFLHIKIQRSEVIVDGVIVLLFIGSILLLNTSITHFFPIGL